MIDTLQQGMMKMSAVKAKREKLLAELIAPLSDNHAHAQVQLLQRILKVLTAILEDDDEMAS